MTERRPDAASDGFEAPPAALEKPLKESLGDASVLLWFASREGKDVDDEVLKKIVTAQSKLNEGVRDPEVEGGFWTAYRKLAQAVQPASIDSILATYGYPFGYHHNVAGNRRLIDAAATKKHYRRLSLCMLFFLIFVQIFWFIGTTWRTDLETHRAELDRIAGKLREMMIEVKASRYLENRLVAIKGDIEKRQPDADMETDDQIVLAIINQNQDADIIIDEWIQILKKKQDQTRLSYANATLRGDRLERMLKANNKMLDYWDFVTDVVDSLGRSDTDESSVPKGSAVSNDTTSVSGNNSYVSPGGYLSGRSLYPIRGSNGSRTNVETLTTGTTGMLCLNDEVNDFYRMLCSKATELEAQQRGVEDALVNSKSILAILSQYLLPLLYGMVGSLAYILRTLSSEIQNVTFTRGSDVRYALRWPLGMLAGVTVGLFFSPADFAGLAAITPLGLAFLAGYGVELVFAGLDRMVSAFTGGGPERARAS
jgi:hypothetical protein